MYVKFEKSISEFIINTWGCKDVNSETIPDGVDSIYFQPNVFIQTHENRGTEIFEEKHLSELPKEDLLEILHHIVSHYPTKITSIYPINGTIALGYDNKGAVIIQVAKKQPKRTYDNQVTDNSNVPVLSINDVLGISHWYSGANNNEWKKFSVLTLKQYATAKLKQ